MDLPSKSKTLNSIVQNINPIFITIELTHPDFHLCLFLTNSIALQFLILL